MSDSEITVLRDDARAVSIAKSSLLGRTLIRVVNGAVRGFETSAIAARGRAWVAGWIAAGWQARRRAVGQALLVAVPVHLALSLWQGVPPGWLWLLVPALIACLGLFLLAASTPSGTPRWR